MHVCGEQSVTACLNAWLMHVVSYPINSVLKKVTTCAWSFFGPQFNVDISKCRMQQHLALGRRLCNVHVAHRDEWSGVWFAYTQWFRW